MNLLCWHLIFVVGFLAEGHFVAHAPRKFFFFCAGFQLSDRHLSVIFFGEGLESMTSSPPFLTLWILVEFAGL